MSTSEEEPAPETPRKPARRRIVAGLVIAFQLLGIVSAVHAVMNVRTEQGTIAWAVPLVAMPYVAVPAYWIFGRWSVETRWSC